MTDYELLQRYATNASQEAFSLLVNRYVDLVYSAARRQVRSTELAKEVTQTVFIDLARRARELPDNVHLAAWLYVVARRSAIDAVRREIRRETRERAALEVASMQPEQSPWDQIEPWLDEAMGELAEIDRRAVLLRFFENKSLEEVGRALGVSADAAQKRVGRAIDQLRTHLSKRGIAAGAAGLATQLSTLAVQVAPAGMNAQISAAATAAAIAQQAATAVTHGGSGTFFKTAALTATAIAIGIWVHQNRVAARQSEEIASLSGRAAALRGHLILATNARVDAQAQVAGMGELDPLETKIRILLMRIAKLKEAFQQIPEQRIPELVFLKESDWLSVARRHTLENSDDFFRALSEMRTAAIGHAVSELRRAGEKYLEVSRGMLPEDIMQLAPYLRPPLDTSFLLRYEIAQKGPVRDLPRDTVIARQKRSALIDPNMDTIWEMTLEGAHTRSVGDSPRGMAMALPDPLHQEIIAARWAFFEANKGSPEPKLQELLPYVKNPEHADRLRDVLAWFEFFPVTHAATTAFRRAHGGEDPRDMVQLAPYFTNSQDAAKARDLEERFKRASRVEKDGGTK